MQENLFINIALKPADRNCKVGIENSSSEKSEMGREFLYTKMATETSSGQKTVMEKVYHLLKSD